MAFQAKADGIVSSSVVGYQQKGLPANKFLQAGAQFEDITSGTLLLDSTISGLPGVDYDDDFVFMATAPHIQVLTNSGAPNMYYFLNDGYYETEEGEEAYKAGWCDSNGNIVDLTIVSGVGYWLKNASSDPQSINNAGQVAKPDSTDVVVPAAVFSINANVYPITANLNDSNAVEFPDIIGVDYDDSFAFMGTAPHIQIVNESGTPSMYYYLNDGYYEKEGGEEDYKAGWCDSNGNIVDVIIGAGSGYWVKATSGSFKITYKK